MTDFAQAMHDPAGTFQSPLDVVQDDSFTVAEKIKILEQWEYDALERQVAEEENMSGGDPTMLSRIHNALNDLRKQR